MKNVVMPNEHKQFQASCRYFKSTEENIKIFDYPFTIDFETLPLYLYFEVLLQAYITKLAQRIFLGNKSDKIFCHGVLRLFQIS